MSYILDALDKAEQDRQHTRAPNLKTVHTAIVGPDRVRAGLWIIALFLVALALLLVLYQSRDSFRPQEREPIPVATSVKTTAPSAVTSLVPEGDLIEGSIERIDPEGQERSGSIPGQVQPELIEPDLSIQTGGQEPVAAQVADILNINDLPASIQRQIPDLSFSTHIYASDAAWRMVGINGKSRREGDNIEGDLVLQEITEQGVVLSFRGYSFTMSVVKNWSSD